MGFQILQQAKILLLDFYYEYLRQFFQPSDYMLVSCDTDSMYVGFSSDNIDSLVAPEKWIDYLAYKKAHFVDPSNPRTKRALG